MGEKELRRAREAAGWDLVAREWSVGNRIGDGSRQPGAPPFQHLREDWCRVVNPFLPILGSFEAGKEKCPVLDHRPADGKPVLVSNQLGLGCGKSISSRQNIVAMKFPQGAVKLIRSPFGHQDYLNGILAILGGEIRRQYAELRDRVDVGERNSFVVARVVRVDPIHQEPGLIVSLTESLNRVLARQAC